MQQLSISQVLVNDVVKSVLGMDKATYSDRIAEIKDYTFDMLLDKAYEIEDIAERALALSALDNLQQAVKANVVTNFSLWDASSSGATWISILTRDSKGLDSVGAINAKPGNFYGDFVKAWNSKFHTEFTKLQFKLVTVPFYYGGDANVKQLVGEDKHQAYCEMYGEFLPGALEFRQKCLKAWRCDVDHYEWMLPDGYEVYMPILSDGKEVDFKVADGVSCCFKVKVPGCRDKSMSHTRGLGANMIHSLDAYALREMIRMSKITQARARFIMKHKAVTLNEGEVCEYSNEIANCLKGYDNTNIMSTRLFLLLDQSDEKVRLPAKVIEAMEQIIPHLTEVPFDLIHVHDEFGALPVHVNQMRANYNFICASVYKGNLMSYFNKVMNMDVLVRPFDAEVCKKLEEADYLLS